MINFKYVRWKNFLSTGNQPTEIQLDRNPTTLIIGENGAGKSTILDALCFGLFGKPFRSISKNQMVNSINNGSTMVEVEFSIGSVQYKVIRGIKPNKFEIYQNDKLLNLEANVRDYQKILEQQIGNESARELGPLKYMAELTGKPMEQIVNWFMLLIIFVFDPLAIALVIAANMAFAQIKSKEPEVFEVEGDMDFDKQVEMSCPPGLEFNKPYTLEEIKEAMAKETTSNNITEQDVSELIDKKIQDHVKNHPDHNVL